MNLGPTLPPNQHLFITPALNVCTRPYSGCQGQAGNPSRPSTVGVLCSADLKTDSVFRFRPGWDRYPFLRRSANDPIRVEMTVPLREWARTLFAILNFPVAALVRFESAECTASFVAFVCAGRSVCVFLALVVE